MNYRTFSEKRTTHCDNKNVNNAMPLQQHNKLYLSSTFVINDT